MKRLIAFVLFLTLLVIPAISAVTCAEEDKAALQYGASGDEVAQLQQKLKDLGYYTGKISGNYLEGTRAGIRKFQKDYGMEITGVADAETVALLMQAEYRQLKSGDDGEDVTRLQEALRELGYFDQKATGKFREATRAAVKEFQAANGLEETGTADLDTQRLLYGGKALKKGVAPTPTPAPDEDPGDLNDMVIAGDGEEMPEPWSRKLGRGSKGEDVKKVQTRLQELGFFDGPISGNFMNKTVAATKVFQEYNGLPQTGRIDEETWNALFNDAETVTASETPRPTPEPTPIPYAITVDVNNQAVLVYGRDENGEYTIPVRHMVCSTGTKATPSDVGEWVLSGKTARWCYFPKWGSHAQYWTRINASIAFHGVIYNKDQDDRYVLSVKSYKKLGQRASHGCVRLLNSDAKWIYENVGAGTVVTITESLPDDEELRRAVAAPALNGARTGPVTTPQPTPEPAYATGGMPPQPFRDLQKGSKGEDVFWLQSKLKELGYYKGTVTGSYYKGTAAAVKAFQKDHSIYPSGKANVKTLEALYEEELRPEETPVPMTDLTPVPAPTPAK